jgi:FkbM family methyltransferase
MSIIHFLNFVLNHPLNKANRWKAIQRIINWQIVSRLMTGPIAFPFVENSKLFAQRGLTGATGNWYCGLHEVDDMAFVLHTLQENDHFLDIGANIGSYTILACAGPKARVTAVEPIPVTYEKLYDNVLLNRFNERVQIFKGGLSDKPGKLKFTDDFDTVNHVVANDEDLPSLEVPVTTIDSLVGEDCPRLIKIDVEGHELPVLRGGSKTLSNPFLLAVIMETNGSGLRYGFSDEDIGHLMRGYGFLPYNYEPFSRNLRAVTSRLANTIYIRDLNEINTRIKKAPVFRVGSSFI